MRTVQTSLNDCILDCHNAMNKACPGVTWVESGQDQQWCYRKPAMAYFINVNAPQIQSAKRVCFPTTPVCPSGNQTLYQSEITVARSTSAELTANVRAQARMRACSGSTATQTTRATTQARSAATAYKAAWTPVTSAERLAPARSSCPVGWLILLIRIHASSRAASLPTWLAARPTSATPWCARTPGAALPLAQKLHVRPTTTPCTGQPMVRSGSCCATRT